MWQPTKQSEANTSKHPTHKTTELINQNHKQISKHPKTTNKINKQNPESQAVNQPKINKTKSNQHNKTTKS